MGRDKATLPFGPECMLQRVVRLISSAIDPSRILVVAAPGQTLPDLPAGVQFATDQRPNHGPLEGLAAGLRCLSGQVDAVYATSCDVPLLVPPFIDRLFELLGDHEIAIPKDKEHHHPLAAVYRLTVLPHVERLLDADRLRLTFLLNEVKTFEVPVVSLQDIDPHLSTLENMNHPEDYQRALSAAGFQSGSDSLPGLS